MLFSCEQQKKDKGLDFQTPYELSSGLETARYEQVIDFYMSLAKEFPQINVQTSGGTDSGYPLHIVTYNPDSEFNFQKISKKKTILFINNGIHPGESDGIDATMLLFRDLALKKKAPPKNSVLVTIPVYNIGGALERNSTTRVNQNGPKSYGFRGNAQNYDLNRDFIKADTENAKTFAAIFHLVKPDIFVDNHVSNGADYQYTLTHLFTQHNKLGGALGTYLQEDFIPALEEKLAENGWDITPYVNVDNDLPESGFAQFMDYPRYSTGYATLWNTLGVMVETHMLKPYAKRVEGTYQLLFALLDIVDTDAKRIKPLRADAAILHKAGERYPLRWALDSTRVSSLLFKGFEADLIPSEVTGFPRIKYDTTRPYTKEIPFYDNYIPTRTVEIPNAYLIKRGWHRIIELLELNRIVYRTLPKDTLLLVESYKILDYKTSENPFEGHYPHYGTEVSRALKMVQFKVGDFFVPTDQNGIRYLMETLEPEATDSFFNWNFFDAILQRKEHFSPYAFEDVAMEMLRKDSLLEAAFTDKRKSDKVFDKEPMAQLQWIFDRSPHYETAHLHYPVYRVLKDSLRDK